MGLLVGLRLELGKIFMAQMWYHLLGSTRYFLRLVRFLLGRLAPGLHAEQRYFGTKTARR